MRVSRLEASRADDPGSVPHIEFGDLRIVVPEVVDDLGGTELALRYRNIEFRRGPVSLRCEGVRHDVVGGEDLGVRLVVLIDVGDQFQGSPGDSELRLGLPSGIRRILHGTLVPSIEGLLCGSPLQVRQVGLHAQVEHREQVPVREQAVVTGPDQELVRSPPPHQPLDRPAQDGCTAISDRIELLRCRDSSREDQGRASQRSCRRFDRNALEQGLGRERRSGRPALQKSQEPFHVRELGRSRRHLGLAAVRDTPYLVENDVRTARDGGHEALKHRLVSGLMIRHGTGFEDKTGVLGKAATHLALDASRLHNLIRQVLPEGSRRRVSRRRDSQSPRPIWGMPGEERARLGLLWPGHFGAVRRGARGRTVSCAARNRTFPRL